MMGRVLLLPKTLMAKGNEGDALQVVNLMQMKAQDWSEGGMLIQDALHFITFFAIWSIQHVKRECSNVAHCLVKADLLCDIDVIDLETTPHCIVAAMQQDTTT